MSAAKQENKKGQNELIEGLHAGWNGNKRKKYVKNYIFFIIISQIAIEMLGNSIYQKKFRHSVSSGIRSTGKYSYYDNNLI